MAWGSHVFSDQDGDDERVNGDDTGHNHGNKTLYRPKSAHMVSSRAKDLDKHSCHLSSFRTGRANLHDQIRSERSYTCDTYSRLRGSVCGADTCGMNLACVFRYANLVEWMYGRWT